MADQRAPVERLLRTQQELEALQQSLSNFSEHLTRQEVILARLSKRLAPDKSSTMNDMQATTAAVSNIAQQLGRLLPQLQASLQELEQELVAHVKEHENLTALYNVSKTVNSTLHLGHLLNLVMDTIIAVTGAERGFLMLLDEDSGELDFNVARNMDRETISGSSFEISRSIVNRAISEGKPILTTNAQADPRFSSQASVVGYSLRSILCVPLRVKGKITGVIYADNRIKTGLFSESDRRLLTAIADQAAVAIENARLFESVKANLEAITNMKNLMDNIFASIASGVITTDIQGQVTLFNKAAEAILGMPAYQVNGAAISEALKPMYNTPFFNLIEDVKYSNRRYIGYEMKVELPQRGPVDLRMNLSKLKDSQDSTLGVAIVVDDLTERKRLEATRQMFRRYLSPAVVDRLPDDPNKLKLGGNRQKIGILFADIRGFTTFSEKLGPEELVDYLNQYLSLAAKAVLESEGTLDKFLGDAVMAIFNAPLPQEDYAERAVRAALAMQQAIANYHAQIAPENRLSYGVGINVGEAVVGNIGTAEQLNYTAIGDAVNLAKRLQENAQPGQILLSESAYEHVKDLVEANKLEPIQVKGRTAVEQVYELIGLK
ncbi:MAG: adenylate/guanylate cyclase domain-containing protein [Anaerolineae bacterium]